MKKRTLHFVDKEAEAIAFLKEHEPKEGYFLGFSGGKDSIVLHDLARRSGVHFTAYYSATGIDAPEVVQFIRDHYPDVIFKRPLFTRKRAYPNWPGTRSFFEILQVNGFPCRTARWCCDVLKKDPTMKVDLKHRLMGIRAEESRARAVRPQIEHFKKYGQWIYKPLFHWNEADIWDYIDGHKLPYCSLYDEGFSRLGCVICPFLCHGMNGQLLKHKERWPKHYAAFEKAMRKLFDNYLCVKNPRSGAINFRRETDFEEFLNNWYEGK